MLRTNLLLTLAASTLMSACQTTAPTQPTTLTKGVAQPLSATALPWQAAASLPAAEHWITADKKRGLRLLNAQGDVLDQHNLSTEVLDSRTDALGTLYVSIDNKTNRPFSFRIQQQTITDLSFAAPLAHPAEGLCLYQVAGQPLQLFVLDEQHTAHHWWIEPASGQLNEKTLRQFPLPPGAEFCVVDDATDRLFISEETIGVWQYNARAESELQRTPIDLVQPWGNLHAGAGPLSISGDDLWVGEKDQPYLHRYSLSGHYSDEHVQLAESVAIDSLYSTLTNDQLTLRIVDDISGDVLQLLLPARAYRIEKSRIPYVAVSTQTDPVSTSGDAADDPAIWIHPQQPEKSRILGTNKKAGLHVYDLNGSEQQFIAAGRVNNVDVRQGFTLRGVAMDMAAASQRDRQSIALFSIHPDSGVLSSAGEIATTLDNVYGFCLYKNPQGAVYAFINDEDGRFEQYHITDSNSGWHGNKVREFRVNSQPEGCAADDLRQRLFVGEEDVAIWTVGAEPDAGTTLTQVAAVSDVLVADIEGMDIYQNGDKSLLIVSSQGNDSYVVFSALPPFQYIGRFRAGLNTEAMIDGASETDGLAVTSVRLSDSYPQGILVVQDGRNQLPAANQNFKYISTQDVLTQLDNQVHD